MIARFNHTPVLMVDQRSEEEATVCPTAGFRMYIRIQYR